VANENKSWPMWKRVFAYAIYALAAAGAIELVDMKVHIPAATNAGTGAISSVGKDVQ
jgi:hypothetical protein